MKYVLKYVSQELFSHKTFNQYGGRDHACWPSALDTVTPRNSIKSPVFATCDHRTISINSTLLRTLLFQEWSGDFQANCIQVANADGAATQSKVREQIYPFLKDGYIWCSMCPVGMAASALESWVGMDPWLLNMWTGLVEIFEVDSCSFQVGSRDGHCRPLSKPPFKLSPALSKHFKCVQWVHIGVSGVVLVPTPGQCVVGLKCP